jgi:hypothetical protein
MRFFSETSMQCGRHHTTGKSGIFSQKHYWRFMDCETPELKALPQAVDEKAA